MTPFPTDVKKLKTRIRSYEKSLLGEPDFIDDSYGKRYLLGPMYLLADDVDGALKSFAWFKRTFPDDIGEPAQYLCWTIALLKNAHLEKATEKLWETMFCNLYLIPFLLGEDLVKNETRHGSNWEHPEYAKDTPEEYIALWSPENKLWAKEVFYSEKFITGREKYLQLSKKLDKTEGPSARGKVIQEMSLAKNYRQDNEKLRIVKK